MMFLQAELSSFFEVELAIFYMFCSYIFKHVNNAKLIRQEFNITKIPLEKNILCTR